MNKQSKTGVPDETSFTLKVKETSCSSCNCKTQGVVEPKNDSKESMVISKPGLAESKERISDCAIYVLNELVRYINLLTINVSFINPEDNENDEAEAVITVEEHTLNETIDIIKDAFDEIVRKIHKSKDIRIEILYPHP